jgi:hypothetical protein
MRHGYTRQEVRVPCNDTRKSLAYELQDASENFSSKLKKGKRSLTMSATRETVSNGVGKSCLGMNELTDGMNLVDLERWRHMRNLSGSPGPCGWTATIRGEDWKDPRRIRSMTSRWKGPDIRPAVSSSWIYASTAKK